MPYNKRAFGKSGKKTYKRFNRIKKMVTGDGPTLVEKIASGVGGVAHLAKAVLPAIAAINTEAKYLDTSFTGNAYQVTVTPLLQCLTNNMAQGTGENERIGNSILAQDIYFRAQVSWLPSSTIQIGTSRFILFCWKDNAGQNAPSVTKILESADINSPINKDYSDQFVILKDKIFAHNAQTATVCLQSQFNLKVYKKLNFHMRWTGASTGNTQNHIYVLFIGGGGSSANASSLTCHSRLNFTDN